MVSKDRLQFLESYFTLLNPIKILAPFQFVEEPVMSAQRSGYELAQASLIHSYSQVMAYQGRL